MGDAAPQCSSCLLESSCGSLLLQDVCRCLWEGYLGLSTWQSFCNLSCFNYFSTTCGRRRLLSPGPHVYYLESLGRSDSDGTYMLLPKPRMDVEVFLTFSGEWTSGETVTKGILWSCLPKRSVPKAETTKLRFLLSASFLRLDSFPRASSYSRGQWQDGIHQRLCWLTRGLKTFRTVSKFSAPHCRPLANMCTFMGREGTVLFTLSQL